MGWRIVRAGSGDGVVLTIDFTVAKTRGQASFTELALQLPEGYAVWGTDEGSWPTAPGLPQAQLHGWLDHGCAVDTPVRAVFGFCGAAALAAVLAGRLAGSGPPAVVLFDPVVVGPQNLIDQTEDSLRQLDGTAPGEAEPALDEALPTGALADDELGELATRLVRRYAARATEVGASRSVRASTVAQLCTRVESYLRYLALCTTAWSCQRVAPDLLVLSRDYEEVPRELSDTPLVRLDSTQHTLLASPSAAQAAAKVLAG